MEEELLPANNNKNDRQFMLLKTKSKYCCCGPINLFAFGGFACSAIHVTYLALFGIAIINISSEYHLTNGQKNLILGSFSMGYALGQIPCGVYVTKYGGYHGPVFASIFSGIVFIMLPMLVSHLATASSSSSSQISLETGNSIAWAFAISLFCAGFVNALYNPSFHVLIAKNVPHKYHNMIHNFIYSGQQFGAIFATIGMDFLISACGWKLSLTIVGIAAFSIGTLWWFIVDKEYFGNNDNNSNQTTNINNTTMNNNDMMIDFINDSEDNNDQDRNLLNNRKITNGFNNSSNNDNNNSYDRFSMKHWRPVLTSLSFWGMCVNHFGSTYSFYFIINYVPTYLKSIHNIDYKELGFISALPRTLSLLIIIVSARIAAYIINNKYLTKTNVRKIFQSIGLFPCAIMFLFLCHFQSTTLIILFIILASGIGGFCYLGFHINSIDLAPLPEMAGLMFCISNTIGTFSGVVVSIVNDTVFSNNPNADANDNWITTWNIAAYIQIFVGIIFILFASGEKIV